MSEQMKVCFKCKAEKPISEFYKHKMMSDGHLNKCKECAKQDSISHRQKNLEKCRLYDLERSSLPKRKSLFEINRKRYRKNYPERARANNAVGNAIRRGHLRKMPCRICGNPKTVGHHPDYNRPLDVVWLCYSHHNQVHSGKCNL